MIPLIKVLTVTPLGAYRLRLAFSNGDSGEHDFTGMIEEGGPMVAPLKDPAFFARVFVQNGVPAWPNGFDIDAIALHREMKEAGVLTREPAAAG